MTALICFALASTNFAIFLADPEGALSAINAVSGLFCALVGLAIALRR